MRRTLTRAVAALALVAVPQTAPAQAPQGGRGAAPPPVVSPDVSADRRVSFRLYAPQAQAVRLSASDIPGLGPGQGSALTKNASGVWELTLGPIDPGSYRYVFSVDGVNTVDPRNPGISESNANVWSLVHVPGSDAFDTKDVPHGAVAAVTYRSSTLGRFRRMHVYTPPGYESGRDAYPVFYLLHGAGDNDHSWSSVGRAGFILDNLIAAKKARPMIVVMPAGHASNAANPIGRNATEDFVNDFVADVMPYVERHYRVSKGRENTAIAGLSMGGAQTLDVAIPRLERFGYIGVFSSGLFEAFPLGGRGRGAAPTASAAPAGPSEWEQRHLAVLKDTKARSGLRLLWFSTGTDDFLLSVTRSTVEMFRKYGFSPVYPESAGGHTWINWRNYLTEFAPQLFQPVRRNAAR